MSSPKFTVVPPAGTDNPFSWMDLGSCVGEDQDLWFPTEKSNAKTAKQICAACPVRLECLEYAVSANERYGVWGGLSYKERQAIRSYRRRAELAAVPGAIRPVPGAVPCASRGLAAPSPQSGQATLRDAQHPR